MDPLYWKSETAEQKVQCLCLGTGRFLRAVLVPALIQAGLPTALIQTRGSSFYQYMKSSSASYPVDTVQVSGDITTEDIACGGAFTLGSSEGQRATWEFVKSLTGPVKIIGMGVTEAGLSSHDTAAMKHLMELLQILARKKQDTDPKICIIDMDNVPNNGDIIRSHLLKLAQENDDNLMIHFIEHHVVCLNTMVDRITSPRPESNGMVPRGEPLPTKALVLLDPDQNLPSSFLHPTMKEELGVVVRSTKAQLDADVALKLRIANGTHTAVAHALALQKIRSTDHLAKSQLWMESYLESLVQQQIGVAATPFFGEEETRAAWNDWKRRLTHPHFGLSTFFITQNGAAKAGIRWGPTIVDLVSQNQPLTVAMVFAYASLIRWLTPQVESETEIFRGWFDAKSVAAAGENDSEEIVSYADGLRYNLAAGWYEFKCACWVRGKPVSYWLQKVVGSPPAAYYDILRDFMVASSGGNLQSIAKEPALEAFVHAVATLVARMVAGDGLLELMEEIHHQQGVYVAGFDTDCRVFSQ